MLFKIQKNPKGDLLYIIEQASELTALLSKPEMEYLLQRWKHDSQLIAINRYDKQLLIVRLTGKAEYEKAEKLRKAGAKAQAFLNEQRSEAVTVINLSTFEKGGYCVAEGMTLGGYQFLKYKSDAKKKAHTLANIYFDKQSITLKALNRLQVVSDAVGIVRDLVNEPPQYQTAALLAESFTRLGKEGRFKVQVLQKAKLEQLNMGGLLAVNRGSIDPPTFTIMEHRPAGKAVNKNPLVLVGKGVVYDTGGLSLKPTPNSMDRMKSDMSGAALVAGAMYIAGQLDLPIHLIGLVPATDNRPGQQAFVPGDVIKMYSGDTVEVLNTDAEGRLLLADALHYAKKYRPDLVLDFATLTGAAANAIGDAGIVFMGTAAESVKTQFKAGGERQYERLVEFPLWEEYGKLLKSDIADLKNIGSGPGGAISAGKFLEHFIDYPWLHFDIAGVSHDIKSKDYRPAGGTAFGLRMLVDFLLEYAGKADD